MAITIDDITAALRSLGLKYHLEGDNAAVVSFAPPQQGPFSRVVLLHSVEGVVLEARAGLVGARTAPTSPEFANTWNCEHRWPMATVAHIRGVPVVTGEVHVPFSDQLDPDSFRDLISLIVDASLKFCSALNEVTCEADGSALSDEPRVAEEATPWQPTLGLRERILCDAGLDWLETDDAQELMAPTMQLLERRVSERLSAQLCEEQLDEFQRMIADGTPHEDCLAWLSRAVPHHEDVVGAEVTAIAAELRKQAPRITEGIRAAEYPA